MRGISLFLVLIGSVDATIADDPSWIARTKGGMVASDAPQASQVGADVLTMGGNAFDAAVATSLSLSVTRPGSTGIGGGGFMVAYFAARKEFVALDFREVAPGAVTAESYAKLRAEAPAGSASPSIFGGHAVGVPGLIAGLATINDRWGRLELKDCIRPVVKLAEVGMIVDDHHVAACNEALNEFQRYAEFGGRFPGLYSMIQVNGSAPSKGSQIRRAELAAALRLIMQQGPRAFYEGAIADDIVAAVQADGGLLSREDLKSYAVKDREPMRFKQGEFEFITMPPPSSGGVVMAETLAILEAARERHGGASPDDALHMLIESMKHAFADRVLLGDPDGGPLPLDRLLKPAYAADRAAMIRLDRVGDAKSYGEAGAPDDGGTSHFCAADSHGNIVAFTETINGNFGSFVVTEKFGIILNNEMDDFTTGAAGERNLFGLVQGAANRVAAGRRPLSSMTPTIILKSGRPFLVLGGSGGPRIISNVLHVATEVMSGRPLAEAMVSPRAHHQWQPDELYFDRAPAREIAESLTRRGHTISDRARGAAVQAIQFLEDGTKVGASDPKKGGKPWASH